MLVFEETLDPSETKDFVFDWSPQLGEGETVVSHTVTFIDAAGTTSPSNSFATPESRVWLTGGNHGGKVIFTIRAVTSGGRTLEAALAVNVIDSLIGPDVAVEVVATLTEELAAVRAARIDLMTGKVVQKIRTGRYATEMWYATATLADYDRMIATLEREIAAAEAVAAGRAKRRPIGLVWN